MVSVKTRFLIAAALALAVTPATAAPWVRGFVVDNYEPAFYYGGRSGTEEPGPDCPKGTIPILDYKTVLKTSWRTQAEIDKLLAEAEYKMPAEPPERPPVIFPAPEPPLAESVAPPAISSVEAGS